MKARGTPFTLRRSAIHGWGLFARRTFESGEMMVEYLGETIGNAVGDAREAFYEEVGIGSCYLFRLGRDEILDATRSGGPARFINHCCDPNADALVVDTGAGGRKIVICARRDVMAGEEITYDYKFASEDGKLCCNCGAPNCRGAMN
uniref:[histone H3]-lysine(4) N-trimethyltransferase n=1 Tax=Phaeomonas parva TaxID=124430 RepID=A0A7S1U6A6_9STRA|mmetsp:Transcript_32911/g.104211  ORF Transcript_32911/g.104211 Transcript_32911/m.104211 type:complete len:147 (+) Transcript_32911:145-585(+)